MFRLLLILLLCAPMAAAQEAYVDGFGVLPVEGLGKDRLNWAGLKGMDDKFIVEPGDVAQLGLIAGPKSLVAGEEKGHVVGLAFDEHGNTFSGRRATFFVEQVGTRSVAINNGIAQVLLTPPFRRGTLRASAQVGSIQSAYATFRIAANLSSVEVDLEKVETLQPENVSSFITKEIRDQFGNTVEEGVGASVILRHRDGTYSQHFSSTKEERINFRVLARDLEDEARLIANVGRAQVEADVGFEPLVSQWPSTIDVWREPAIQALRLHVGPLTTVAGHLLPDGAPVSVLVVFPNDSVVTKEGWVREGVFETMVPQLSGARDLIVAVKTPLGQEISSVTVLDERPVIGRLE